MPCLLWFTYWNCVHVHTQFFVRKETSGWLEGWPTYRWEWRCVWMRPGVRCGRTSMLAWPALRGLKDWIQLLFLYFWPDSWLLFDMKTLEVQQYGVITAYKLDVLEILRIFLYYHILRVPAIPTYRVYQLYDSYNYSTGHQNRRKWMKGCLDQWTGMA